MTAAAHRVRAHFTPIWEGSIEGWTINFIRKNKWRTQPAYDFAELLQEAWVQFLIVQERYPEVVDPPHFMALYKRLFSNRVHDIASRRTKERAYRFFESGSDGGADGERYLSPTTSDDVLARAQKLAPEMLQAELDMLVEDAPGAIRGLILAIQEAPEELLGFLRSELDRGVRESAAERLARLAGLPAFARDPDGERETTESATQRVVAFLTQVEAWALGLNNYANNNEHSLSPNSNPV